MTLEKANNYWQLLRARVTTLARFSGIPHDVNENISSRREMLRGVLITGCGLLVPIAFLGCELQTGSKTTNTSSALVPFTRPRYRAAVATGSLQASVRYQAQPNGTQQCSNCAYFVATSNTCQRVDGRISASGWCDLWARNS